MCKINNNKLFQQIDNKCVVFFANRKNENWVNKLSCFDLVSKIDNK